jgi:hypothetical protein
MRAHPLLRLQEFIKDVASAWADHLSMTDYKTGITIATALIGLAAMLPVQWRVNAARVWSYGVYYVGYRLLSVQLTCGSAAVSAVPLVMKHA